jgi:hypothetical protein
MSIYSFLTPNEHIITVRDRATGYAKQYRYWNNNVIKKVLKTQKDTEDIYVTKYPKSRLIDTIILDFDSEDIDKAYHDVKKLRNYLEINGLNSVIVKSGSKGYHIYIEIAPFLFNDTNIRKVKSWNSYFNAFVCFLIHDGESSYPTLDQVNFSAGLNGNIRLIGSKHPKTGETCEIIEGEFLKDYKVTKIQDFAQKTAYAKLEIKEEDRNHQLKQTKVFDGDDPIQVNDLREVFRDLTGDIKIYPKGYGYCCCPEHNDSNPSLLVTKEWFSCSGCSFKGNIFTLKKKGYVEFGKDGVVR